MQERFERFGLHALGLMRGPCPARRRAMKRADASLKEDSVMMSASSGEVHSVDDEEGSVVTGGGVSAHHVRPFYSHVAPASVLLYFLAPLAGFA